MPIRMDDLRAAAQRTTYTSVAKSLTEARAARQRTAFLCHSSKDRDMAKGVQNYLAQNGWAIYVDWEDASMPEVPNRETADKIRNKIKDTDWLLFLATPNSTASRWCPWEIGFSNGGKGADSVVILPTTDNSGNFYGNEYLQLYRKIDITSAGRAEMFEAGHKHTSRALSAV